MSIKRRCALSVPELQTTDYRAIKTSSDGNYLFNALSFGITGSNIRFYDFTYCIVNIHNSMLQAIHHNFLNIDEPAGTPM